MTDTRIQYFYKKNGGPASTRNFGLAQASGTYVAFLDSDDYWPLNYLEVMLSHLENNPTFGGVYSPITVVHADGRTTKSYKRPVGKSGWLAQDLFKHAFIWPSAAVFRTDVWEGFFFDERLNKTSEDSDAFLRLSVQTPFRFVPEVEAFHTLGSDSISAAEGVVCSRVLSLERFYHNLGGNRLIPAKTARRRLSHAYRTIAKDRRKRGARSAALALYRRAIRYWPFDLRLYLGWFQALMLSTKKDMEPHWRIPNPLGEPIGPNRFARSTDG